MLLGDLASVEEFVRNLHLAALGVCAFLVFSADFTAAKSTFRPLVDCDFKRLHRSHSLLTAGLIVFWLTGLFLIWCGTGFDIAQFSPKLVAKIAVVTLLTINAMAIGHLALPYFERNSGKKFGQLNFVARMLLACCGAMSFACWISAICLGAIPWLKTASALELINFLGPIYAVCFVGATLVAAISSRLDTQMPIPDPSPLMPGNSRRTSHISVFAAE